MTPWKTTVPLTTPTWVLERNPYSVWVDTDQQPAAVHRPDPDDARREPGDHQPAGHRRRVRLTGPAHRHHQVAGAAREPAEGRLPRVPRSIRTRAPTSGCSAIRTTRRTRRSPSRSAPASSGSRSPTASTAPRSMKPSSSASGRRARRRPAGARLLSRPGVQDPAHRLRRQEGERDAGQARAHQEGQRRVPPAHRWQGPASPGADDLPRIPVHEDRRDDDRAVEEDRHPRRDPGDGARRRDGPGADQRAPDLLRDPVGRRQYMGTSPSSFPPTARVRWGHCLATGTRAQGPRGRPRPRACAS